MFLKNTSNDDLVEVLALKELFDPYTDHLVGRYQHGEEVQDAETFNKSALSFLSGEPLPRCWLDSHYRDDELEH